MLHLTWVNITNSAGVNVVDVTKSIVKLHSKDIVYLRKTGLAIPEYQKKPEHCNGFVTEIHLCTGKTIYVADADEYICD